jgi:hypothetical protein
VKLIVGTRGGLFSGADGKHMSLQPDTEGREVTSLARHRDKLWVGLDGKEIHRHGPDEAVLSPVELEQFSLACMLPTSEGLLVGTSRAHLGLMEDGFKMVDSFEEAPTRSDWYTPWGGPPATRSMSKDLQSNIYVNVHVGGILRSGDMCRTWRQTIDIHADVHQVLAHRDRDNFVAAATAWGLGISDQGGYGWEFYAEGLHATYARAVALADENVYLTASDGPRSHRAAVYRTRIGSYQFERCERGLPEWFGANIDTGCLAAAKETVVFGTEDGAVYISHDEGDRWEMLRDDLPPVTCLLLG